MVDLYAEVRDIKTRLSFLEANTMSGMPGTPVKDRFDTLHDRVDTVGRNLLDKMDKNQSETRKNFAEIRYDLSLIHVAQDRAMVRFEQIDGEFFQMQSLVNSRFEKVEGDIAELKTDVTQLKTDVAELKTDVAELKTDVAELKTGMSDIKSMLVSLGAKAPVTA